MEQPPVEKKSFSKQQNVKHVMIIIDMKITYVINIQSGANVKNILIVNETKISFTNWNQVATSMR